MLQTICTIWQLYKQLILISYATNHIYHLAYNYKLSTNSLEIHKITMKYLPDICVLHLSVTTVLANASLLSYCKNHYSAFCSLNWWLHYHCNLEKNNTTIDSLKYWLCYHCQTNSHIELKKSPISMSCSFWYKNATR